VTPTDGEVIARVIAGDVAAYGILVDRYHARFARFATGLLGNKEDAEEALQDAFVRAYRALDRYEHRERFGSWFYRILLKRCRSLQARRPRKEEPLSGDEREARVAAGDAPLAAREEALWIIGQLPLEQREVFLLHFVLDLGYDDIAGLTGLSVSAIKMRVSRGLDRLRELLEGRHG
jgi:RNA polymerase sigma-70 factor (ECF subfamily)